MNYFGELADIDFFGYEHLVDFSSSLSDESKAKAKPALLTQAFKQLLRGGYVRTNPIHAALTRAEGRRPITNIDRAYELGGNKAGLYVIHRENVAMPSLSERVLPDVNLHAWAVAHKREADLVVRVGSFIRFWGEYEDGAQAIRNRIPGNHVPIKFQLEACELYFSAFRDGLVAQIADSAPQS